MLKGRSTLSAAVSIVVLALSCLLLVASAGAVTPYYGDRQTSLADLTGDGMADYVMVFGGGSSYRPSNGSSFDGSYPYNWPLTHTAFYGDVGTYFEDVTGDGRADGIAVNGSGITVRRARSTTPSLGVELLLPNETWTSGPFFGTRETEFKDVTGDGKADAIVVNADGVTVRRSTGSGFSSNETWVPHAFYGSAGTYFADVNGDGKSDAIAVNSPGGLAVKLSSGSSFGSTQYWTSNTFTGNRGIYFSDVTGDGKSDAIVNSSSGGAIGVTVRRSTGSSFAQNETWISGAFYGNGFGEGMALADVTGDQKADATVLNTIGAGAGVTVRRSTGIIFSSNETWLLPG